MAEIDESKRPSVRQVRQEFMVREDGALAQRLQDEEFGHHYIRNRSERKTVREDVKAAKITYLEEVKQAQLLPCEEFQHMAHPEEWLASDLQHKLQTEEVNCERKRRDSELKDEEIARKLQEKEAMKLERARQRRAERQLREERESKILQEALSGLQDHNDNQVNHRQHAETQRAPVPVGSRNGRSSPDTEETKSRRHVKGEISSVRGPEKRFSMGEGAVVQLPPSEGGRLECDRIILADGTAIDLFDENEDKGAREQAHKRSRERQDEEYARKLQEQENKLLEQDRHAEHDRKLALEYQDREFAKELQRREYIRLQKLKRERQLQRAQTVPAESSSGSTGELQSHQRLPSYEEATHRNRMPDLLQDEPTFKPEHDAQRDNNLHRQYSCPERPATSQYNGSFERDINGAKRLSRTSSNSPPSTSLDRDALRQQEYRSSDSPNSSQQSSLERSAEFVRQTSQTSSTSSSSQFQALTSPTSQVTHEEVWERLYEEDDQIPYGSRDRRVLERRVTVASSEPSNHINTELINNGSIPNGNECNIAEFIDPTFGRKSQNGSAEEDPTPFPTGVESKAKPVPLIQPHRRRSSDKKKREKEKECKQQ